MCWSRPRASCAGYLAAPEELRDWAMIAACTMSGTSCGIASDDNPTCTRHSCSCSAALMASAAEGQPGEKHLLRISGILHQNK